MEEVDRALTAFGFPGRVRSCCTTRSGSKSRSTPARPSRAHLAIGCRSVHVVPALVKLGATGQAQRAVAFTVWPKPQRRWVVCSRRRRSANPVVYERSGQPGPQGARPGRDPGPPGAAVRERGDALPRRRRAAVADRRRPRRGAGPWLPAVPGRAVPLRRRARRMPTLATSCTGSPTRTDRAMPPRMLHEAGTEVFRRMRAENYFAANRDLSFYYERVIDWDRLVPFFAEGDDAERPNETAASWREVLGVAGEYIGKEISARSSRSRSTRHAAQGRHQGLAADGREPARPGRHGPHRAGHAARVRRRGHAVHRPLGASSRCSREPTPRPWSSTPFTRVRRR